MTFRIKPILAAFEVSACVALVAAVFAAVAMPEVRGTLTWVAASSLAMAFAGLSFRCGIGLLSYFVLIVVVMPAISYWGFLWHGEGGMMASTISLVRAGFVDASIAFLILYLIGSALSTSRGLRADRLDTPIIAAASRAGQRMHAWENWLFSTLAIVSAYIYQPSMPGLGYQQIEYNLIAGHAWNYVCLTAYVLVLATPRKTLITWIAIIGVPVWLVLHFDRADILGLVLLWLLVARERDISNGQLHWYKGRAGAAIMLGGVVVLLFGYIGAVRSIGFVWSGEVFVETLWTFLNYPTVQAVNHAFAAAIEFVARLGHVPVIAEYPVRVIPSFFVDHPAPAEHLVQEAIGTVYGMHLAGEFYLQFGVLGALWAGVGVVAFMIFGYQVMRYLYGSHGAWGWYAISILMAARIGWYGFFYYVKVILIVLPALLLFRVVINEVLKAIVRGQVARSLV